MRLAVFGATGVAGRALVPRAIAAGHSLRAERTDILDGQAVIRFVQDSHAVINLATSIPTAGGRGNWTTNDRIRREGTANLIAACAQAGVKTIIQQSVAMLHCVADDRPQTEDDPIAGDGVLASALDMEELLRAAPLDWRIVRGALFYGPGTGREEAWIAEVRSETFRIPGDASAWVSLVHVDDFADAMLAVLHRGDSQQAYIACDDAPLRLRDLYDCVAASQAVAPPKAGGVQWMRSFRVSNAKLRALGWKPNHRAC
ncbi:MAG TPA: NAD(P)-dependent oxidoreductase [Thermoanaerobaculia bacterium]|nr:NAD(P)-dependent oxidoreductase [Thermoanaerobaculia bacterium]